MTETVIKVQNLSKQYRIGAKEGYKTFRETLIDSAKAPFLLSKKIARRVLRPLPSPAARERESQKNTIWALKDVSFQVKQGEVVGIIGRNGAGKSTLLKVLCKITEPTEGRVELRGRVGSLLEVGTGFHPELTGHENVYLYGAILGMDRWEVTRKFDEIIAFAELEKFVDTPVKRYSSGMYMRLAFAVAAHLEPDILLVDEVLAVGDLAFQKKCLGKMEEVSGEGRTVLFVSHNMSMVSALCSNSILLRNGKMASMCETEEVIQQYRASTFVEVNMPLAERKERRGNGELRFTSLKIVGEAHAEDVLSFVEIGQAAAFIIGYISPDGKPLKDVDMAVRISDIYGSPLLTFNTRFSNESFAEIPKQGEVVCHVPEMPLLHGTYRVDLWGGVRGIEADYIEGAGKLEIIERDFFKTGRLPVRSKHGPFLVSFSWSVKS